MTGEILGAAGAIAGRIVGETAKDIRETNQTIRKEIISAAKETEPFKQAAHTRAKRIAIKETVLLQMYRPIRKMLGISADYFEHAFEDDMGPRVESIPEQHRVAPKPSIAAPAMQGLAFSLDEPELKELYLDLLAAASDGRHSDAVHPAFVEVIRQLSAEEIPILAYPLGSDVHMPVVQIVGVGEDLGTVVLHSHLMEIIDSCPGLDTATDLLPMYVDNWVRLGLVDVSYTSWLLRAGAYEWADERQEFQTRRENLSPPFVKVEIKKGLLKSTAFGTSFALAVGMGRSKALLDHVKEQTKAAS